MSSSLQAEILAASQPLRVPGAGEQRILTPMAVERLASSPEWPRWRVEALALELDVTPLHYLRNMAQFGFHGQIHLLRSFVTVVGTGPALLRAVELLAINGVGRLHVMVPISSSNPEPLWKPAADRLAAAARNRNASSTVTVASIHLRGGNPAQTVMGANAVAACLEDSMDEQLLQFACRMAKCPLVLTGVEETRGQATTVMPGDPGVALVYKPTHPHLEPRRAGTDVRPQAALVVGTWIAEEVTRLVLGNEEELLRNRLLYVDVETEELTEYPL